MDVVNLQTALDSGGVPTEARACIVADAIDTLVNGTKNHFAMYFVFKDKLTLPQPFKVLLHGNAKTVTQLKASLALKEGFPIWSFNQKNSPRRHRYPDDYIKIDFFKPAFGRDEGKIVYTVTDVIRNDEDELSNTITDRARVLGKPTGGNKIMYITFPLADTDVYVLSEKSMGSFIAMKARRREVPSNRTECRLLMDYCLSSILNFACGRSVCQNCWDKNVATKQLASATLAEQERCLYCCSDACKKEDRIRLKLRQGPCPIDMCTHIDKVIGVVLLPCACHINCDYLRQKAISCNGNYDEIIWRMPHCPYDACKTAIETIRIIKD